MKKLEIYRRSDGLKLGDQILLATKAFDRMKGLLGRNKLSVGEGLLIVPCNSVHTFFMRFPITTIFLNKENKVIGVIRELRPWKVTLPYWRAAKTLELPCNSNGHKIKMGDQLEVKCIN